MSVVDAISTDEVVGRAEPVNSKAHAYAEVRKAIMEGRLAPGEVVSQVQLAAELDISRTPLREALRQLQSEGLLDGDFNRRIRVAPLTVEDLEQIAAMRIALETFGVQSTVPLLTKHDLEALRNAFARMDDALKPGDLALDEHRIHHRIFHTTLFSRVGGRMRTQLTDLWDNAERYRVFYRQSAQNQFAVACTAQDEHANILEAAEQGQAQRCGHLIAEHLGRTALTSLAKLAPAHDPWIVRDAIRFATGVGVPDSRRK
ncbi:GntR family transcriptional regulator [Nocardia sp. CA-120079]|uniref:GntR family transcriptional regulator n=1 Tax=Nocardia sp. CA-120079 TaxID=3239974 RepID=UPI003D984F18